MKWINDLVNVNGAYLPHLLPVDQTLPWANPPRAETLGPCSRPPPNAIPAPFLW